MRCIVVTGTDTGVGKTIVTAALAVRLRQRAVAVHIRKPVQTGLIAADDRHRGDLESRYTDVVTCGDAEIAGTLAGVAWSTGVSLRLPMAPAAAAAAVGVSLPTPHDHAEAILACGRDAADPAAVIVEGAGGLLVDFGDGHTLADIAAALSELAPAVRVEFVIVARPGLGTLNHTALTCEALRVRGPPIGGIVLGSWPPDPAPVAVDNRRRLGDSAPVLGAVPAGAGQLRPAAFRAAAGSWTSVA
ncbi:dethiobiotin synthase [Brevibacterium sp. 2SA]|uniref:dethiobiotin synthase n=1 Tax=Brevibacterium sp. 2SA TaxID=2502198 RepID=UPI0010F4B9AF|nr:dethiobiotin synthase [Brevibacterium sp. 2SA]